MLYRFGQWSQIQRKNKVIADELGKMYEAQKDLFIEGSAVSNDIKKNKLTLFGGTKTVIRKTLSPLQQQLLGFVNAGRSDLVHDLLEKHLLLNIDIRDASEQTLLG